MAENGNHTATRPHFAPWLGLSENIRQPRFAIEPLPPAVGEGYRLRLFVLDVAKTKEVEIDARFLLTARARIARRFTRRPQRRERYGSPLINVFNNKTLNERHFKGRILISLESLRGWEASPSHGCQAHWMRLLA